MQRLKILVIPCYKLFPIETGGAHGQLSFLDKQQFQHDIDILITPEQLSLQHLEPFKERFPKLNLICKGFGKITKFAQFTNYLKKEARKKSGKDSAYGFRKMKHINLIVFNSPTIIDIVHQITSKKKYDIVQIEHTKNLSLVDAVAGSAKKIFIHHEIYFNRVFQDMRSLHYNAIFSRYISNAVQGLETYWLRKYDGIITFNVEDKGVLQQLGITSPQQIAQPFALFEDELDHIYEANAVQNLAFIGGEGHYPNKMGLLWFIKDVWPLILKKTPGIILKVVGNWSKEFRKANQSPQVQFTGFVESLDPIFKTSIMVVPIKIGSGIKIKTITAMAKGNPIVATHHGADAIPGLEEGKNMMITDDAVLFADKTVQLLENSTMRQAMSSAGFNLAQKLFRDNDIALHRNEFYTEILL